MNFDTHLIRLVHDILFREWDPLGVNADEATFSEYSSYDVVLLQLLKRGADERRVAEHLLRIQENSLRISPPDPERDKVIALRLLTAYEIAQRRIRPARSAEELLERYQAGERVFNGSRIETDESGILAGSILNGLVLRNAYVKLSFQRASLRGADFWDSELKGSDFSYADLRGARFVGSVLSDTSFQGARLEGAEFNNACYQLRMLKAGEFPDSF
ncbi:pentapeptide repeat-containing protein [Gimesia chilikensis]|uniref:pentapeptide repeat-containing protein n=1 Tax=Gimesia chilikensis TaxID=2605989 RepID=UPI003A90FE2F